MNSKNIQDLLTEYGEYFAEKDLPIIEELLMKYDNILEAKKIIKAAGLKKPSTIQKLSIFGGWWGIDRFMVGDVDLGIVKLISFGGLGLLNLFDIFFLKKRVQYDNLVTANVHLDPRDLTEEEIKEMREKLRRR